MRACFWQNPTIRSMICRSSGQLGLLMKYSDINDIEKATRVSRREMARFGFALLFIIAVMLIVDGMHLVEGHNNLLLVIAAMIGGYMALNIGAVLGAGVAAGGWHIVNWSSMGAIAASWVVSPLLGGLIAALFLFWIKRSIAYQTDMVLAAKKWCPF